MKNLLAILAVAALVVSNGAHAYQQPAPHTNNSQNPSLPIPQIAPEKNDSPTLQKNPDSPYNEKDPKTVKIILPPKDIYDYIAFGASLLLALVGLGGVLAAVFTLLAINKQAKLMEVQAGHMKTQSEHMETQLKDARSALKKTLVLQFRPKLIIRGGIIVDKEVTLWVTNMGGTPAHIVRAMISIMLTSAKYEDVRKGVDETIATGTTFTGGESRLVTIPITEEIDKVLNPVPAQSPTGSPLSKPVLLAGFIRYRDDLGIVRNTGLWRRSKGNLFVVDPDSDWDYSD